MHCARCGWRPLTLNGPVDCPQCGYFLNQRTKQVLVRCPHCGSMNSAPKSIINGKCLWCRTKAHAIPSQPAVFPMYGSAMPIMNQPGIQPLTKQALIDAYNQLMQQAGLSDPLPGKDQPPDEWEVLIIRAREQGLTQEDIELALHLKASGLTRADIAVMEALKEKLHG